MVHLGIFILLNYNIFRSSIAWQTVMVRDSQTDIDGLLKVSIVWARNSKPKKKLTLSLDFPCPTHPATTTNGENPQIVKIFTCPFVFKSVYLPLKINPSSKQVR